ncbi:MAG: leucine-rich repeat domain-containing protein [Roseburia sp.]|nr:leucine-rich repeat domain-containing protein [Anaeroplasma bactoclasticum]MCM1197095.1 leucine-rich repeat domain-containing protein [Roseburia sp.]MCM1557745.1 leucine-rich repeat domain-containing protein [Anaeroplasma bactoclasticum]
MKIFKKLRIIAIILSSILFFVSCTKEVENPSDKDQLQKHECSFPEAFNGHDRTNHWHECTCGKKSGESPHEFEDWTILEEATEEKEGIKQRVCTICKYADKESIPTLEHQHSYPNSLNGYDETNHWYECSCGEKKEVVEHSFGSWTILKEATEEEKGLKARSCENCNYQDEEEIPLLPHTHQYVGEYKYDNEKHWKECSCGEVKEKLDHSYSIFWSFTYPTALKDGLKTRKCQSCSHVQEVVIPKEVYSSNLEFELNEDQKSYYVKGIGTCTDKTIVIPSFYNNLPVTRIGENAFLDCTNITSIRIPERYITDVANTTFSKPLEAIGKDAFKGCTHLTAVYFYGTLKDWCGFNCSVFESLSFSLTGRLYLIDEYEKQSQVSHLEIPEGILKISDYQFAHFEISKVSIPSCVESIGEYAFYRSTLSDATISSGVKELKQYAFATSKLSSIALPGSIEKIGEYAFNYCIYLHDLTLNEGIKEIGENAFANCEGLHQLTLPNSIEKIGTGAFMESNLTAITFGSSLKYIDSKAFYHCALTTINIPNLVEAIGDEAFLMKSSVNVSVEFGSSVKTIGEYAFSKSTQKNLSLPNTLVSIGAYAFANWHDLRDLKMSNQIQTIGENAFLECYNLLSFVLPESIEEIGENAFLNCYRLVEIFDYSTLNITKGSLANGSLGFYAKVIHKQEEETAIKLEDDFVYIKDDEDEKYYLVSYHGNETEIALPNTLADHSYYILDYALYDNPKITLIEVPYVESIGFNAFGLCSSLANIILPYVGAYLDIEYDYSSQSIEKTYLGYIFGIKTHTNSSVSQSDRFPSDLTNLKEITITGGTIIPNHAFHYFKKFTILTLPKTIESIGIEAFSDCSALEHVYYEGSLEDWMNIEISTSNSKANPMYYANHFYLKNEDTLWEELTHLEIPSTVEVIKQFQFLGFNNLLSVTIPESVTEIKTRAFENCYRLVELYNYSALNIVKGSNNNGYVGYYAKVIHTKEEESAIFVVNQLNFVKDEEGNYYFVGTTQTNPTELILPKEIEGSTYEIIFNALGGYNELVSLTLPFIGASLNDSTHTYLGYIYGKTNSMANMYIPSTLKELTILGGNIIDKMAIRSCYYITTIKLPKSIIEIRSYAFDDCRSLKEVYYEGSLEEWENIIISNNNSDLLEAEMHYNAIL